MIRYEHTESYPHGFVPPVIAVPWAGREAKRVAPETGPDGFPIYPEDPRQEWHRHISVYFEAAAGKHDWDIHVSKTAGGMELLAGDARSRGQAIMAAAGRMVWFWKTPTQNEPQHMFVYHNHRTDELYMLFAELFQGGFELTADETQQLLQIITGPMDHIMAKDFPLIGAVMAVEQVAAAGPLHLDFQKDVRRLLVLLLDHVESCFHQHFARKRIIADGGNPAYFDMDDNRAAFRRLLVLLPGEQVVRELAERLIQGFSERRNFFSGGVALKVYLDIVEAHVAGGSVSEEMRADLERIQQFANGIRLNKDDSRSLGRIQALLSGGDVPCIEPGEAWSDAANLALKAMSGPLAACWVQLIDHCATADPPKPTKKWAKLAEGLITEVGWAEFKQRILEWFPLVARPRTVRYEGPPLEGQPDPDLIFTHRNTTILRGLVWCCAGKPDAEISRTLSSLAEVCFKKHHWLGARCPRVGNACLYSLSHTASDEAAAQLTKLDQVVKQPTAKKRINKSLDQAAETTGQSRADLEEKTVPTYGLDQTGRLEQRFGSHTASLQVIASREVEVQWKDETGKALKSVPTTIKKEHAAELKKFQKLGKDIEQMLAAQRIRLERLLLTEREWALAAWRERYLDQPLLAGLARRLIWHFRLGDRSVLGAWLAGKLVDADGEPLTWLTPKTGVRLWHPIGFPVATITAWREWLAVHEVCQPFKQAHREVYLLTDAELGTATYSNRFAAHILGQHQFAALCRQRGWKYALMGAFDSFTVPTLELPQWNLAAEYWVNGTPDMANSGICVHVSTDQVRFARDGQPVELTSVPALVFTEVMRDVDLFVGVCSVGTDPAWQGQQSVTGGEAYWQSFSFGELNASARTRREVLEHLLPKLKIASCCTLQERFLVVKGSLRTYQIHLGSGNIQMEPNNQYLCIVPDQSAGAREKEKQTVFLPFEGDRTLSIILSKAFLLANDRDIKDASILNQIRIKS